MSEDFLLEDEDLYQQPEDDDLRETLNKHLNDTEHDKEVVHNAMHALTDVMISTSRDYDLAMNCKCVLMEFYRRQGLNEEEEIARIDAHAHNLDEFDKFMKARNGDSDCYMKPYEKWKFVPMGNVKKKPYDAMVNVVDCLKKLLEKEGKVA